MLQRNLAERLVASRMRIAVTGATGWFGRVTLDLLGQALGPDAFSAQVTGYASRPRPIEVKGVGEVQARSLDRLEPSDWLFHYAFLTQDRVSEVGFKTYVADNFKIMRRVLDLIEQVKPKGLFYTSSGAARHPDVDQNPYGALKRLDEILLSEACRRQAAPCVIARVFNVSGPHMTKPEQYALGDLIQRAQAGQTLKINAKHPVVRSFVAVRDIVALAIALLLDGKSATFDAAGEQEVEIGELADLIRTALNRPDLAIKRDFSPDIAENRYAGNAGEFTALAARYDLALTPLDAQIRETAALI